MLDLQLQAKIESLAECAEHRFKKLLLRNIVTVGLTGLDPFRFEFLLFIFQIMKEYKKYFILHASPEDVYNALTNPLMLEIWTGEPAQMSEEPGSDFYLWDGSISGTNVAFEKNHKIVQHWYFGEDVEPSEVTIKIHPHEQGTSLEIRQTNIPDEAWENMSEGWELDYIGGLQQLFEE